MVTPFFKKMLLAHILGTAKARPVAVYAGLLLSPAKSDGTGIAQPCGGGYARVKVSNWKWNTAGFQGENGEAVEFPKPTKSWGPITHIGLFDAARDGRLLVSEPLEPSVTIGRGECLIFAPGRLTLKVC